MQARSEHMGKRKQPEICSVDNESRVVVSEDTLPAEGSTTKVTANTGNNSTVGSSAEGRPGGSVDNPPPPAATVEHPGEGEPTTETIWSLFEKVGRRPTSV